MDSVKSFAVAWIDISTGEFRIAECDRPGLAAEIARLEPGEIIVSDALYSDAALAPYLRSLPAVTPLTRDVFDGATAERRLTDYFAVATSAAFGTLSRLDIAFSRDQGRTEKAIAALEEVVRKYPTSEYATSAGTSKSMQSW